MLRTLMLAGAIALAITTTSAPSHAAAPEPTEKCDNLQDRCLHHENGICIIWHDECMVKKPVGHGAKRSRHRLGAKKNHV